MTLEQAKEIALGIVRPWLWRRCTYRGMGEYTGKWYYALDCVAYGPYKTQDAAAVACARRAIKMGYEGT